MILKWIKLLGYEKSKTKGMKKLIIMYICSIWFCCYLSSCEEYIRTEVVKEIYVNKSSINGFVGEEVQLIASPTDAGYQFQWSSEDDQIATVTADGKVKLVGEGFTNILVTAGEIKQTIEIYSVIKISIKDILLSEESLELTPGEKKTITVQRVPDNANDIPSANWTSENSSIATVNEIGDIVAVNEGQTNIKYTVGTIVKNVKVLVSYTKPFNGPHYLKSGEGLEINAADFDFGGQNYAFNDDAGNNVGNDNYRKGKGDTGSYPVEVEGDGDNIGYVNDGDWYQYTVDVLEGGEYQLDISLSANGNGIFHIEVDGVRIPGDIDVPSNGSWNAWKYHPVPGIILNLNEGIRKVKFVVDKSGFNFKALRFKKI